MKNILVVDDELDILDTIIDTFEIEFEERNIKIYKAANGVEALELFKSDIVFDLIVTDINMPEMDGIELTQYVKGLRSDMPVIVFTGHGDMEEQDKLTALGVIAMIKKPYVEDLLEEVNNSLK